MEEANMDKDIPAPLTRSALAIELMPTTKNETVTSPAGVRWIVTLSLDFPERYRRLIRKRDDGELYEVSPDNPFVHGGFLAYPGPQTETAKAFMDRATQQAERWIEEFLRQERLLHELYVEKRRRRKYGSTSERDHA